MSTNAKTPFTPYAECGHRYVMLPMPSNFDNWGFDEHGNHWDYSFCVIDDFGDLVPVDPFVPYHEGHTPYLAPEFGDHGKYVLHTPSLH